MKRVQSGRQKLLLGLLLAPLLVTAGAPRGDDAAAEMTSGAGFFLASLGEVERGAATFSLGDDERLNWHYVPRARKGAALASLTPAQHKLAHALMASGLSREGYIKATQIMFLEEILRAQEKGNPVRDAEAFSFSVFGDPSASGAWAWRVEGHHLSLNFTLAGGRVISATPAFFGANPAEIKEGLLKGMRVLAAEEELARRLIHSFQGAIRDKAILDVQAPADILTRASRKAEMGTPAGLALAQMDQGQARLLIELIEVYAHRLREELAQDELAKIRKAGREKIHFAWAGGLKPGQPHYYRVQGPTFVIEYDNTQNSANHIHSVWRNFEGDFGLDVLRAHYAQSHRVPARGEPAAPER